MFDVAPWLSPINDASPSGRELSGEPRFDALVRMTRPSLDVVRDPRSNNPVSQVLRPVDWSAVLAEAEALRAEGRDLRLLAIVARAMLNERGFDGLADGLTLVARTVGEHWETLHPRLGVASVPREAAQRRVSTLFTLQMDREGEGLLADLRARTIFVARGLGPVTGWELERGALDSRAALAEAPGGMGEKERAEFSAEHERLVARVATACVAHADQAPAEMAALVAGLVAADEALTALEGAVAARLGEPAPLTNLRRCLQRMRLPLERVTTTGAAPVAEAPPLAEPAGVGQGATLGTGASLLPGLAAPPTPTPTPAPAAPPGQLATRQEVMACLDRIIEFYDRAEPASPVPYLARRMRRMVPMDFLELMEDLAPSGLKEFQALAGLSDDKKVSRK